ncbi:MAG: hypothetical protein OIF47_08375 [Marinibacterium sp.]|nr:hypothetical protein [Marinibacterium sp.]
MFTFLSRLPAPQLSPAEPGSTDQTVAEIVTFRLRPGADAGALVTAAQGTQAFLAASGAVLARSLSQDEDGLWTDHILWRSMAAAKETEAEAMTRPEFGAFFALMDDSSVSLRHAPVHLQSA